MDSQLGSRRRLPQRSVEIALQIANVLDANGHANQAVTDAKLRALRCAELDVAGLRGEADDGLHAAQTGSELDEPKRRHEALNGRWRFIDERKRQHAAKAAHLTISHSNSFRTRTCLLLGDVVVGMRSEAWIVYLSNGRMPVHRRVN